MNSSCYTLVQIKLLFDKDMPLSVASSLSTSNIPPQKTRCTTLFVILEKIKRIFLIAFEWLKARFNTHSSTAPQSSTLHQSTSLSITRRGPRPSSTPSQPTSPPRTQLTSSAPKRATTQDLINFYRGDGHVDDHQRTLSQIWNWNDCELEDCHSYIQWLFPNKDPTPHNKTAPLMDAAMCQEFQNDSRLRENLHLSFLRMFRFYGLDNEIIDTPEGNSLRAVWLRSEDHNHLRITRILLCLNALGLREDAQTFYRAVLLQVKKCPVIPQSVLKYWKKAAQPGPYSTGIYSRLS